MPDRELVERAMDDFVVGDAWPQADEDHPDWNGDLRPVPPRDVETASRILRRLKALAREKETIDEVVDAEIRRLEAFRSDSTAGIAKQIEWGAASLGPFMREWSESSHRKTLPFADGKLSLRAPGAGRLVVFDEERFVEWATQRGETLVVLEGGETVDVEAVIIRHPDLVRVKVEPIADALKALPRGGAVRVDDLTKGEIVTLDGETIVPGVRVETATEDKFDYTIGKD